VEEQCEALSKSLIAHGIPVDIIAGFDLWAAIDKIDLLVEETKERDNTVARAHAGEVRITGVQTSSNVHAATFYSHADDTEVLPSSMCDLLDLPESPIIPFLETAPPEPASSDSDEDCEWEEDAEMFG
jgi:hypothetical protein